MRMDLQNNSFSLRNRYPLVMVDETVNRKRKRIGLAWFDDQNRPLRIEENGRLSEYRYEDGRLAAVEMSQNGGGVTLSKMVYNRQSPYPTEQIVIRGGKTIGQTHFNYDNGRLLYQSDESGQQIFRYDASGRLEQKIWKKESVPDRIFLYGYGEKNLLAEEREESVKGELIRLRRYGYNRYGDVTRFEEINGGGMVLKSCEYQYPAYFEDEWLRKRTFRNRGFHGNAIQKQAISVEHRTIADVSPGESYIAVRESQSPVPEKTQGIIQLANGQYKGEILDGEMHGFGELTFDDGSVYRGEFAHNAMDGTGVMQWRDGRVYRGEFAHNRMHGSGSCVWPKGERYQGGFDEGEISGSGAFLRADEYGSDSRYA